MSDIRLSAELSADISKFAANLQKASGLSDKETAKIEKDFQRVALAAMKAGGATGAAVPKMTKDFTGLSRVIQDLPFGFIAISNNLTQLIPGVGALGLAFSGIVAALSFLQIGTDNWTRGLGMNKEAVDELEQSGDDYLKTLDAVNAAQLKGSQNAQKDITELTLLYKIYQDGNLPLTKRKEAYEELQKLYPAYFGNLKFEAEASDKTKAAYDRLTTAILATARARAAEARITENSSKQLENESKLRDIEAQLAKTTAERVATQLKTEKASKGVTEEFLTLRAATAALAERENNLISERRKLVTENNKLTFDSLTLQKEVTKEISNGASVTGEFGKAIKTTTKAAQELRDVMNLGAVAGVNGQKNLYGQESVKGAFSQVEGVFNHLGDVAFQASENAKTVGESILTPFQSILSDILPKLNSGFETFFTNILEHGKFSIDSLGKAILNTFESVLASQVTGSLVNLIAGAAGIGKDASGKTVNTKGKVGAPLVSGILGGGALLPILGGIAVGGILASLFKKRHHDPAPVQSFASTSAPAAGNQVVTVIMKAQGRDLVGTLNLNGFYLSRVQNGG